MRIIHPYFLESTLNFKLSFEDLKPKFYLTLCYVAQRLSLLSPVSVGSHYREIQKQINTFFRSFYRSLTKWTKITENNKNSRNYGCFL